MLHVSTFAIISKMTFYLAFLHLLYKKLMIINLTQGEEQKVAFLFVSLLCLTFSFVLFLSLRYEADFNSN